LTYNGGRPGERRARKSRLGKYAAIDQGEKGMEYYEGRNSAVLHFCRGYVHQEKGIHEPGGGRKGGDNEKKKTKKKGGSV